MTDTLHDARARLDAFLLDRLTDTDRAALEERFFVDDAFASEVLAREDDLVDALAAGTLSDADATALRGRLEATAEGSHRLRVARALHTLPKRSAPDASGVVPARESPVRSRWIGPAAVAVAAGMAWLIVDNARLRERIQVLDVPAPTVATSTPSVQSARDDAPRRVVLSAERSRGATDRQVIALSDRDDVLHLVLPDVDGPGPFAVRVETSPGGDAVAHWSNVPATSTRAIEVWVGAGQFATGDYEVLVTATTGPDAALVGQYAFRVDRSARKLP